MQKQGSTMLKVTSILMIVFAGIGLIIDIATIAGYSWIFDYNGRYGINLTLFIIALAILVLAVVMELIAGIVGVANWNNQSRAGTCMGLGVTVIVMVVLGNVLSVVALIQLFDAVGYGSNSEAFSTLTGLLGVIVPILYVIGASQLKRMNFNGPVNNPYYGQNTYSNTGYQNGYGQGQGGYGQGQGGYGQGQGGYGQNGFNNTAAYNNTGYQQTPYGQNQSGANPYAGQPQNPNGYPQGGANPYAGQPQNPNGYPQGGANPYAGQPQNPNGYPQGGATPYNNQGQGQNGNNPYSGQ